MSEDHHPLHKLWFEWHDLPVAGISILENGMVIDVLPLDEQKQDYDRASLSLLDPDAISLDLNGALTRRDLDSMAVASLDVVESSPGRITGKLGLIVRDGYWEIGFTNAVWRVVDYHYMPKTERM